MEQPLSLLTFSGSIPEAIMEAKNQRKVFVVYISGENEDSVRLEKSVWLDSRVAECITKYCVLLHLPEGTTDATNFSAIYPQKSSPCINAVGYNGMLLWQNDGCISPENLISSIEKAWLSLHIQETTATVLTAALSSKKIDQSLNETSTLTSVPHKDGESSGSSSPVPSEKLSKPSGSAQLASPEAMDEDRDDDDHVLLGSKELPKQKDMKTDNNEQSVPPNEVVKVREPNRDPAATGQDHHEVSKPCHVEEECSNRKDAAKYPSELMNREIKGDLLDEPSVPAGMGDSSSVVNDDTSSELLLNIRLPTGANLQDKFLKIDALRLVKGYVDSNMADFNGSYDLAIPYPRKVFKDQDLDKSLSELGIINRQGLVVVPHQRALHQVERGSSSNTPRFSADTDSSTGRVGGYFSYVRKMLSYVNPFSYVGASADSSTQESPPSGISREAGQGFPNLTTTMTSNEGSIRRRSTSSRIGSNIHTLKHDEDDMNDDRNTYWNGNSTEFGGNDNDK